MTTKNKCYGQIRFFDQATIKPASTTHQFCRYYLGFFQCVRFTLQCRPSMGYSRLHCRHRLHGRDETVRQTTDVRTNKIPFEMFVNWKAITEHSTTARSNNNNIMEMPRIWHRIPTPNTFPTGSVLCLKFSMSVFVIGLHAAHTYNMLRTFMFNPNRHIAGHGCRPKARYTALAQCFQRTVSNTKQTLCHSADVKQTQNKNTTIFDSNSGQISSDPRYESIDFANRQTELMAQWFRIEIFHIVVDGFTELPTPIGMWRRWP